MPPLTQPGVWCLHVKVGQPLTFPASIGCADTVADVEPVFMKLCPCLHCFEQMATGPPARSHSGTVTAKSMVAPICSNFHVR